MVEVSGYESNDFSIPENFEHNPEIISSYRMAGYTAPEISQAIENGLGYLDLVEDPEDLVDYQQIGREEEMYNLMDALPLIMSNNFPDTSPREVLNEIEEGLDSKLTGYLLRTYPIWEDNISDAEGEELAEDIFENLKFGTQKVYAQYLDVLQDMTPEDSEVLQNDIIPDIRNDRARHRTTMSTPYEQLPEKFKTEVPEKVRYNSKQVEGIVPRIRGIKGARGCDKVERLHRRTLLDEDPTKNTVLLSINGEIVGSWKKKGMNSIFALQDVESEDGRYPMRKGWVYRSAHNLWKRRDEAESIGGWDILEVDSLPLEPLRRAGEKVDESHEWFRQKADERLEDIQYLLE